MMMSIKDLFAKNPKRAYVVKCKNCESSVLGQDKVQTSSNAQTVKPSH